MLRLIAALPLATALLAFSPAALAENPSPASYPVSYSDLDLSNPAGVDLLMKRLNTAAKKVCGKRPMTVLYGQLGPYLDCRHQAMADAVRRIGSPAVTFAFNSAIDQQPKLASR
jgi:UrcA family protein